MLFISSLIDRVSSIVNTGNKLKMTKKVWELFIVPKKNLLF